MIPDEVDGGSRRQDDFYGRAAAGAGKSGVPADSCDPLNLKATTKIILDIVRDLAGARIKRGK
jgi:hypothetical protein